MGKSESVWGLDIGQGALKAVKLCDVDGKVQVETFHVLHHHKSPTLYGVGQVHHALKQFLAKYDVTGSRVAISMPGKAVFTRFVDVGLPPVMNQSLFDRAQLEAGVQIPYPIEDVEWRYHAFGCQGQDSSTIGIFSVTKADLAEMLSYFTKIEYQLSIIQAAPIALYNFMVHDAQLTTDGITLLVDVGASETSLVMVDGEKRAWIRTLSIGGKSVTGALMKEFSFSLFDAEEFKVTSIMSEPDLAKRIFQAMRPVFTDLVHEIQRSIGYYTSLHREAKFKQLIGFGNGFRISGLQEFLQKNLNLPVTMIDRYNQLTLSPAVDAEEFTKNVPALAVACGLALQGLGRAAVSTNFLPSE